MVPLKVGKKKRNRNNERRKSTKALEHFTAVGSLSFIGFCNQIAFVFRRTDPLREPLCISAAAITCRSPGQVQRTGGGTVRQREDGWKKGKIAGGGGGKKKGKYSGRRGGTKEKIAGGLVEGRKDSGRVGRKEKIAGGGVEEGKDSGRTEDERREKEKHARGQGENSGG